MKSIWQAVFNLPRSQAIFCVGYNVNLQTAVVAIFVFVKCPQIKSIQCLRGIKAISNCEVNPTSGFYNLPLSQAIFCIGYNVNLKTALAAILVFIECPKSIVSEVLVVLRSYQICEANQTSGFQDIAFTSNCGWTARRTGPFHKMSRLSTGI